jgi:hypothetical protein
MKGSLVLDQERMERDLFSDDNFYKSCVDPKSNLEGLEQGTAQLLRALIRGEKPYKSISRAEMKKKFGKYDGYTDFNDIYAVDDLSLKGRVFTVTHEYLHYWTGKGSNEEKEVMNLTYEVLRNVAESKYADPEVRKLARKAFNYGKWHPKRFYGDAFDGRIAFQEAAGEGNQEREPIDEIFPYIWRVPLAVVDYAARIFRTCGGNLLNLGGPTSYNMGQEIAGIRRFSESADRFYQTTVNRRRAERRRGEHAEQQQTNE